ncbi:MAG: nucleoside-diphosphate kinase, partial [Thermoplasmata archaeon]|nr:nucleoside-diphosphate kinase [Thermoplasmata archaeon]
ALVLEGEDAVEVVRGIMGKTDPKASPPGTIRGDLGMTMSRNVVHGSDSAISAAREISLFFPENELMMYKKDIDEWVYPQID